MKTRHHLCIPGSHPGEVALRVYVYVADGILPCDEIAETVERLTRSIPSQEVFTQRLADRLRARVKTVSRHLAGAVVTTVVCGPTG
jgi:hypothetical protein